MTEYPQRDYKLLISIELPELMLFWWFFRKDLNHRIINISLWFTKYEKFNKERIDLPYKQ